MTRTLQKSRDGGPISSGAPPSQDPEFYPAGAPGGLCCEPHLHSKRLDFTQPFAPFVMCWVSRMVLALGDVFIIFISVGDHQRDLKKNQLGMESSRKIGLTKASFTFSYSKNTHRAYHCNHFRCSSGALSTSLSLFDLHLHHLRY